MCGIVGIFDIQFKRDVSKDLLVKMNEVQHHRGPDESGVFIEPGLGIAHKRLSIIDLSSGKQPLFNEDKSVVVVYNGEIYNFKELTQELNKLGHSFKTHSDTEVIVHAWEEWGAKCVEKFRGMFAFAVWDRNQEILFLARDRLGIKPLYYTLLPDGQFLFSSEFKSILVDSRVKRVLDPLAVEEYFSFGYVPEPKTIIKNVKKLSPGFTICIKRGNVKEITPQQYWDIPFNVKNSISEIDAQAELIERLKEAVNIRLVADVPLGAFLSGGVDSSAVVALMAGYSEKPVNTCSISFGEAAFNESTFASQVAHKYHTNHQVEEVNPDDFELIDALANLYDEPFADSSAIPTYRVCELARKKVIVALSGDGGDENFAGYSRYARHLGEEKLRGYMPFGLRSVLFGFLGRTYPDMLSAPRVFRAKATFQMLAQNTLEGYLDSVCVIKNSTRRKLFSNQFESQLQGYNAVEVLNQHLENAPTEHPLSLVQYLDMKTYLPGDILTKVDRASMAHSLEVRVPVLDHKLVEWSSSLPPEFKLNSSGVSKYIFKKSLESYLPDEILYRRKMGFAVPLGKWFRGPLKDKVDLAVKGSLNDTGIFSDNMLKKLFDEHQSGKKDNSAALWSLLMFDSTMKNIL